MVSALAQRVEALEGQEQLTQVSVKELSNRVQALTGQLLVAIGHLEDAEEEARKKPKGLFGGRS